MQDTTLRHQWQKETHLWQKETHQCPKTDMNARHHPDGPKGRRVFSMCVQGGRGEGGRGVAERREIANACVRVSHTICKRHGRRPTREHIISFID